MISFFVNDDEEGLAGRFGRLRYSTIYIHLQSNGKKLADSVLNNCSAEKLVASLYCFMLYFTTLRLYTLLVCQASRS